MKKVDDILTHLKYSPEFKKLNTHTTLDKLINTLPLKLKKGVKFAYVKKEILFFVLTHPVYKMEFTHSKELIRSLLKTFSIANIEDIRFFVTNVIEKKEEAPQEKAFFDERSYGIFENKIQDKKLHQKMELIRSIIKST
ncbi:MAG: DUF721 domain-containing protein [Candidatus Marinarcus sp.]|uniref:DUF721 domain-containing protein n=1 Tax=Candidatus Marinarcus sp. TaxID=3100987 RepID=UPI003B00F665